MKEFPQISITGFLKIYDPDYDIIYFDGPNSIHQENMSLAIAKSLINNQSFIDVLAFGNGGLYVDPVNNISYLPTNRIGKYARLYNQIYTKNINNFSLNLVDSEKTFITVNHQDGTTTSDIKITCFLDYNEPINKSNYINEHDTTTFIFNELGLKAYSVNGEDLLLTHVIFDPKTKLPDRLMQIEYTIRIQLNKS